MERMSKVLVIEDSLLSRETLKDILGERYELLFAEDGTAGMAAAREDRPDIILLDIHLPGLDGYQVCRLLKEGRQTAEIPVIFITAMSSEKERVKGFDAGAEDYIVKPFFPEELLARVKVHLESRRAKEQAIELEKLKILQGMAVALSHQINNPLTAIYGCMYILQHESPELKDEARASLEGIREGLERIRDIVNRLSHASRVATVSYDRNTTMIDINNI